MSLASQIVSNYVPAIIGAILIIYGILAIWFPALRWPGNLAMKFPVIGKLGNPTAWTVIICVVIGFLAGGGAYLLGTVNTASAAVTDGIPSLDNNNNDDSIDCPDTSRTVTIRAVDHYTAAATNVNHAYRLNGGPVTAIANAGTFTGTVGDKVEVLFGGANTTGYFSELETFEIKCAGTPVFVGDLYQNGTLSLTIKNEAGTAVLDGTTNNETLGAGDVANLDFTIQGTSERGYPHGFYAIIEYNSTDYDKITLDLAGAVKVDNPTFYKVSSVDNTFVTYKLAPYFQSTKLDGVLTLDVKATPNPGTQNDPSINLYPANYFTDEDNGGAFSGPDVEDEDDTQTYLQKTSATISVM